MHEVVGTWTLTKELEIPQEGMDFILPDETVLAVFQTVKDKAFLTNKRLILRDASLLMPKKIEIQVIPCHAIQTWTLQPSGKLLDRGTLVELWTVVGRFQLHLKKEIVLDSFERTLAKGMLEN